MTINAVKGMNDVRPGADERFLDTAVWDFVLGHAAEVLKSYGYRQVIVPIVEETALFARGIGEETDIVSKEMYSFSDRGDRSLTLRPEGTAGVVRAYIEHNLGKTDPVQRLWYAGPMFRAEAPQKGRYRQFYQVGAELLGIAAPQADAEMLIMLARLCSRLGVAGLAVRVNSLGDAESRGRYREALQAYLQGQRQALCESCLRRVDTNPLRVLDCKRGDCRRIVATAPDIIESLTPASRQHFDTVQQLVAGAGVPLSRDPRLVRGLDYYTGTIFEFTTTGLGAQDAVLGGGRYDELVAQLGGPPTPAIGFAAGVERLALLVAQHLEAGEMALWAGPHLYIVPMLGAEARALALGDEVRAAGAWRVEVDVSGGRLKQQMRRADKVGALCAVVIGENELASGRGRLKNLRRAQGDDSQPEVALNGEALAKALQDLMQANPRGAD
jgi:histidyl-tRNA synthetase